MAMVLVTGGAGFIGMAVSELLLANGYKVRVLDTESTVHETFFRSKNILSGAEKIRGSILDYNCVSEAAKGCDFIIHLAARLGVKRTDSKKLSCLNINIQGTVNILEACLKGKAQKIIFASSSEVYGEPVKQPISEDFPVNPKSVYAVSKLAGEEYVKAYKESYGLDFTIVRLFNIYGKNQVAEFVVPRFVRAVQENKSPVVYGDGNQVRSFCYVEDAAKGIIATLNNQMADSEIINIGNNSEPVKMKELAERVVKLSGKKIKINFSDFKGSDRSSCREIYARIPDISKAQSLLNFAPKFLLEEGLKILMASENIVGTWYGPD